MSKKSDSEESTISDSGDTADVEELALDVEDSAEDIIDDAEITSEAEPVLTAGDLPAKSARLKKRGNSVAWLALLLSAAALTALAYLVFEDWRARGATDQSTDFIAGLDGRVDATQDSLSNFDSRIAALAAADADIDARFDSQQRNVDNQIRTLDSLPTRLSALESTVASLQGVSAGTRDTWLLSEAEYYMQIANAQLQLAGNPHLATLALRMADERIVQLANPALIEVRAAIADELAGLDVMERPDIEGVTLTLSSLARVVDSLPLRGSEDSGSEQTEANNAEELSGVDRALASVKDAMSGLVKVTPPDQVAAPFLTPDAVYFLRTNLTLHLQVARLALLRGETTVFKQSLDDASAWLQQYFDTNSAQVSGSLQTISEIRDKEFEAAPPDISNSLRLLRQIRTLAEPAQ